MKKKGKKKNTPQQATIKPAIDYKRFKYAPTWDILEVMWELFNFTFTTEQNRALCFAMPMGAVSTGKDSETGLSFAHLLPDMPPERRNFIMSFSRMAEHFGDKARDPWNITPEHFTAAFTPCTIKMVDDIHSYYDALGIILDSITPATVKKPIPERLALQSHVPAKDLCPVLRDRIFPFLREKGVSPPDGFKQLVDDVIGKPSASKNLQARHEKDRIVKGAIQKKAAGIWEKNKSMTIVDMIKRDEINITLGELGRTDVSECTLTKWLRPFCPDKKPGRRPTRKE